MFQPPRIPTTIQDLPAEIWLNVSAHITHSSRNSDLTSLSLVSRRWRPIAQEWLLKNPRFNITYIHNYMLELAHHAHLLPQVRTLEIWSTSAGRVKRYPNGHTVKQYNSVLPPPSLKSRTDFLEICTNVINHVDLDGDSKCRWKCALHTDVVPALLGVLLCALPNLTALKFGEGWLMDFPIFTRIFSTDLQNGIYLPHKWNHEFLQGAITTITEKLEVLEVPADMTSIYIESQVSTAFDYRRFGKLKDLGCSMRSLLGGMLSVQADLKKIFPPSLEVLRISEATFITANFLDELCLAKTNGHFPALRRVEVYHLDILESTLRASCKHRCLSPVHDVQHMFASAGVALYLYFPTWPLATCAWEVGSTPWRLREGLGAREAAEEKHFWKAMGPFGVRSDPKRPFEAEWDEDGDAVMVPDSVLGSNKPWWMVLQDEWWQR
jgi:hypothetical protein